MPIRFTALFILCTAVLFAPQATTAEWPEDVQGEVLQLHMGQTPGGQGTAGFDEMTIRTRQGELMRVRLGEAGTCRNMVRQGDRVRLKLLGGGPVGGAYCVRSMKVRQTGASYQFRNGEGEMIHDQTRSRLRDGSCDGNQGQNGQGGKGTGRGGVNGGRGGSGGGRGGSGGGNGGGGR